ncbi:MAG: CoxG family protein [Parvibaculaceae bacterium]
MIRVEEEFDVEAGAANVYQSICDVGEIGYVIAGVQHVDVIDEDHSTWKVQVKAGMIAQTLTLSGEILTRTPPSGLTFRAEGRNVALSGLVELTALGPALTRCRVAVESQVTGKLAALVSLIVRTTQRQLINQTIANFRRKLEAESLAPAAALGAGP